MNALQVPLTDSGEDAPVKPVHSVTGRGLPWRFACAIAAGLCIGFAFPPTSFSILPVVGVALYVLMLRGAPMGWAVLLGVTQTMITGAVIMRWLDQVGIGAVLAVSFTYSVIALLAIILSRLLLNVPGWPVWIAAVWVSKESLLDRFPFGGFSWGQLAFSQADTRLGNLMSWGGGPLLSFLLALLGGLLAWFLIDVTRAVKSRHITYPLAWGFVALPAVTLTLLALSVVAYSTTSPGDGEIRRVLLVQGGDGSTGGVIPQPANGLSPMVASHVALTRGYADAVKNGSEEPVDFGVWAEGSGTYYALTDPLPRGEIQGAVDDLDSPVLVGAGMRHQGNKWLNMSVVWEPTVGPTQRYAKRHLVPFAEYLPPTPGGIGEAFWASDKLFVLASGEKPGILDIDGIPVSTMICFEISQGRVVREAVLAGGQILVLQSNNAGFMYSGQADQQFAIARLRAIEHGRSFVVVGLAGPSAIVQPNGEITQILPEGVTGAFSGNVQQQDRLTFATRFGPIIEILILALVIPGIIIWYRQRRRERSNESSR